jgi:hypothetical protein
VKSIVSRTDVDLKVGYSKISYDIACPWWDILILTGDVKNWKI